MNNKPELLKDHPLSHSGQMKLLWDYISELELDAHRFRSLRKMYTKDSGMTEESFNEEIDTAIKESECQ